MSMPRHNTRRPRPKLPEHGDWRVHVDKPHETEHLLNPPLDVWRRLHLRVEYLQSVPLSALRYGYVDPADEWQPVHGWKRAIRLAIGLCGLLPLSIVMVFTLMVQLYHAAPVVGNVGFWLSEPVWFTMLGGLVFMVLKGFRLADPVLVWLYVLGHELTHALAALLCFARVEAVKVDLDGGYVDTDADNLFIALSPYFVPLWMLVWLGVLFGVNFIAPFQAYQPWFYAGFGFWWCFHLYWTTWMIPREQPDLLENGVVISTMIIMLMNIGVLLVVLRGFGVLSFSGYLQDFVYCARQIYVSFLDLGWLLFG
ncbi:MAG: hypothetical protein IKK45_07590 [Akkermansia sp.]|nr:hypothetical protein [Akkermansia sp.]